MPDTNRLSGKTVNISLRKQVTSKDIDALLKDIYKLSGCLACGLIGFDLHFKNVGDPAIDLGNHPNIGNVELGALGR